MRISDWSSDVCSSDLTFVDLHAPDITVEQIVEAGRDAGQRIFESLIGHARFAHDQIPAVIGPEAHDLGGRRTNAERTVITAIDDAGRDVQCALEFAQRAGDFIVQTTAGATIENLGDRKSTRLNSSN